MPIKCTMFSMQFRRRLVLGELFRRVHCVSIYWYLFCCIMDSSLCMIVDGERWKQLILMHFDGQQIGMKRRLFYLFFMCDVQCMLTILYQFVVLKRVVSCCHIKGKFWWNCCCLDVCLIRFSEQLLIYFAFTINWHFQACHYVCHEATSTFNILTFSSQFTASHCGIRRNLRTTGVSTVYDVKIATKIWTEEMVSV